MHGLAARKFAPSYTGGNLDCDSVFHRRNSPLTVCGKRRPNFFAFLLTAAKAMSIIFIDKIDMVLSLNVLVG